MGRCRFLYDNVIVPDSRITVSSQARGLVTRALKQGTGSAIITTGGVFSGARSVEYLVKIDCVSAGTGLGQATFKWSDDGGLTWAMTGVPTAAGLISLNNGVTVRFTSAAGPDFALNDTWFFKGVSPFGTTRMLDLDRDSRWRSAELQSPNTITIELGAPVLVQALVLYDHNLTASAEVVLKGDLEGDWGGPEFAETVAWSERKILHYLSTSAVIQNWRLEINDPVNPDGRVEIGELYLGSYLELSRTYQYERQRTRSALISQAATDSGVGRDRLFNLAERFDYSFGALTELDAEGLNTLFSSISDAETGLLKAIWFNEDSDRTDAFRLVKLLDLPDIQRFTNLHEVSLTLNTVLRSV